MGPIKKHRLIAGVHLSFLTCCAVYITFHYPSSGSACIFLLIAGVAIEIMPHQWRQRGLGEIGVLVSAILAYALSWLIEGDQEIGLQGLARMILITWILIPSRPGLLRPLILLLAMELLLLSSRDSDALLSTLILSSLAICALFFDSWLRLSLSPNSGTRIRNRSIASPWRHIRIVIPLCCVFAFSCAWYLVIFGQQHPIKPQGNNTNPFSPSSANNKTALDYKLHIGSSEWVNQESQVIAKYIPDDSTLLRQQQYLRALAVPVMNLESGGGISWNTPSEATKFSSDNFEIPQGSGGHVIRFPAGDKILLRPDGADIPPINQFFLDSEANVYLAQPNSTAISYRCSAGDNNYIKTNQNTQRDISIYLELPAEAQRMLQRSILQLEQWRVLNTRDTALEIVNYLDQRCRYQINNLPQL
ncbi:MAG: hypothetical protein HRU15_13995, partial [Planctomycetes bacterium]|nr:hypothetical protein [Planctomycetota bacterium]